MRKTLILLSLLLMVFIVKAQYKTFHKNIYGKFANYDNTEGKLEVELDSILFTFEPDTENFWDFKAENKSKTKVSIDWQNAFIVVGKVGSPIVFGTDSRLLMNQPKQPEIILPDTYIKRKIDQKSNFEDSYTGRLFAKKYIKDGYEWHVKVTIPIIKNEISKEYLFDIIIYNIKN